MAFNKSFNLTPIIKDMNLSLRRQTLFSMVGSVNSRIVSHAIKIAEQLTEYDYKELSHRDIELLTQSVDNVETLDATRKIANLAREWRDMLVACTGDEESGSIAGAILLKTGKQKLREANATGVNNLTAIGRTPSPERIKAKMEASLARTQAMADAKAKFKGFTEFIIDQVFAPTDDDNDEFFTMLPTLLKEQLVEKFVTTLRTAIVKAEDNELDGWRGEGILCAADIVIAEQLITEVMAAAYPKTTAAPTLSIMTIKDGDKTVRRIVTEPVTD